MAGPAGFTTDDVSDVTVLRELEKIKKFIIGKTVTFFGITNRTETTVTLGIKTNDKEWTVDLPIILGDNLVYTDIDQVIDSVKEFLKPIKFGTAVGTHITTENARLGSPDKQGIVIVGTDNGVKIDGTIEDTCEITFGDYVRFRDRYRPKDAPAGTKDYELSKLNETKEDIANKINEWSAEASDTKYPSEALVKRELDGKAGKDDLNSKVEIADFDREVEARVKGDEKLDLKKADKTELETKADKTDLETLATKEELQTEKSERTQADSSTTIRINNLFKTDGYTKIQLMHFVDYNVISRFYRRINEGETVESHKIIKYDKYLENETSNSVVIASSAGNNSVTLPNLTTINTSYNGVRYIVEWEKRIDSDIYDAKARRIDGQSWGTDRISGIDLLIEQSK